MQAAGLLSLKAGQDINAKAANVSAGQALHVAAGNNIDISAGEQSLSMAQAMQIKRGGFLSSSTTTTRTSSQSTTAVASSFEGASVNMAAGQDLSIQGASVLADQDVSLSAGRNIQIEAAQNTSSQSYYQQTTKSGLMSSGLSVSVGKQQQSLDQKSQNTTAQASTVGSTAGNVRINAGKSYTQTGSYVLTPAGNIDIAAKKVLIGEARETGSQSSEQRFQQSGISVGLTGGMIDTLQATTQAAQGVIGSGSDRSKALNALVAWGKGADLYEQGKAVAKAASQGGASGAAASGIKISVSVGNSSSQSNSNITSNTAAGSTVKAGGNVNIKATEGDLTVQGSNVQAAQNLALAAAKNVNVVASADTETNRSTNKSSAASVGVSFGVGAGSAGLSVDVAASRGKGQANSDSTTYNNSHVTAGQQVSITSGTDTNIVGGNITAQQVTTNVGGNLNVQSLQDTATSKASQSNVGIALSIPVMGAGGSASLSMAKQNSNSNYQSVGEQSGIQAGADGFHINVKGNTDLKGAVIASNADASNNSLNTGSLTTSDLENRMSATASSSGVSVGTNMLSGKYELGKAVAGNLLNNGSASESDTSTAKTAISAAQVTVGNNTTDTSKGPLTDSKGQVVSSDTSPTNRTLVKADVAALQQQAQQKQADNMLAFKAVVAIADDGLKKMAKPQLLQVFCMAEPCSNDQVANTAKIGAIAQQLMNDNPGMTKNQATTLAVAAIVGKDGDPSKADPKYLGSDSNRLVEPDGLPLKVRNIQTVSVTVEDLQNLPNDQKVNSTVFANGIFNNEQRAAELAVQQTPKLDPNDPAQRQQIQNTGTVLQGNTYLVSTDKSNNSAGEYITAGVEKLAEILGIPTPAAELKAQAIKALSTNNATGQTDNPVNSIGHSRGTMTDVNTYNALGSEGFYNPNLKVTENNPAAKQERIEQSAGKVTDPANVQIYAPRNDPVSTFVGGYGTDNKLEALKEVPAMATTSNSVHSSPGSGAVGSNSADVNNPFSYQGLEIDQLNKAKQPQTNAILQQVQANPKPVPITPPTDQATKVQEEVSKDSNVQMNQLLTAPTLPSAPSISAPQVPSSRLEQLNQFKKGN